MRYFTGKAYVNQSLKTVLKSEEQVFNRKKNEERNALRNRNAFEKRKTLGLETNVNYLNEEQRAILKYLKKQKKANTIIQILEDAHEKNLCHASLCQTGKSLFRFFFLNVFKTINIHPSFHFLEKKHSAHFEELFCEFSV